MGCTATELERTGPLLLTETKVRVWLPPSKPGQEFSLEYDFVGNQRPFRNVPQGHKVCLGVGVPPLSSKAECHGVHV